MGSGSGEPRCSDTCSLRGGSTIRPPRVCCTSSSATIPTSRSHKKSLNRFGALRGKSVRPTSLREAVDRIIEGYDFFHATNEFLDEFYVAAHAERQRTIVEEPRLTGMAFQDAYVGALGEHLARRWGLDIASWTEDPRRFLEEPISRSIWSWRNWSSCATAPLPSAAAYFHRRRAAAAGAVPEGRMNAATMEQTPGRWFIRSLSRWGLNALF